MSGINPYTSLFLQSLYAQGQANPFSVQAVDILNLPPDLRNLTEAKTIEGKITTQSPNGKVTIETPQGQQVDVKLKTPLPIGTKIDLQIPSGKSQSEGILQPTLTRALNQATQGQGNVVQSSAQNQTQQPLQTKSTEIIADVKNLQVTAQKATLNASVSENILRVGQSVRLSPLPSAQQNNVSIQSLSQQVTQQSVTNSTSLSFVGLQQPVSLNGKGEALSVHFGTSLPITNAPNISTGEVKIPLPSSLGEKIILPTQNSTLPIIVKQNGALQQPALINKDARIFDIAPPRINIVGTSPQPQNTMISNAHVTHIVAHATGHVTTQGNPVVQLASASGTPVFYEMHYPAQNLPAGTQITLETLSVKSPEMVNVPTSMWKSMQNVMEFLAIQLPSTQSQSLMQAVPSAQNAKSFPAAALLFLAAAKGGDLSGWLGTPAMSALQNAPINIKKSFEKMTDEILKGSSKGITKGDSALPAPAQASTDWRGYILPMMFGGDIHKLPLWVHDQYGEDDHGEMQKLATRFVIDLALSRMGNIQIDGIIRNSVKQFDMVIMTEADFGQDARDYITDIWQKTLQSMEMHGGIDFRRIETI